MRTFSVILLSLGLFASHGCKKKPSAGLGGNANLKVFAKHHSFTIDSAAIYIKFNSSEAPDNIGDYDISEKVKPDAGNLHFASFSGLKKGDYYIYAEGWDPSISENVKGGIPYTINEETNIEITVPVTEVH